MKESRRAADEHNCAIVHQYVAQSGVVALVVDLLEDLIEIINQN
ncbi:MAG TPA: hypothetical protein VF571_08325 [Pyrinomonadaceae bacterium]